MKNIKIILLVLIGAVIGGIISIKASELISSSQILYKDNNTVSQALDELFSAVDINERLGNSDISGIGDGTVTGAISKLNESNSSAFRYNAENDYIEVLYNNTWEKVLYAGLKASSLIPCTGGSISVSGTANSNYPASKAIDGSNSTLWLSALSSGSQWIKYSFGKLVDISSIYISSPNTGSGSLTIQALINGEWKTMASGKPPLIQQTVTENNKNVSEIRIVSTAANYVDTYGDAYTGIYEMQVYGREVK